MRVLHRLVRVLGALALCACFANIAAPASAQDTRTRARQLYAEGQALFQAGQYAQAEASFRAAYSAVPNPVVLRAIAAAQERQGNNSGALASYTQYLRDSPNASDRAEVERRIQELGNQPGVVTISSTPPGASVVIDGSDTGQVTPANISVGAGQHTLELRLTGYTPVTQSFNVTSGARLRLEASLQQGGGGGVDVFGEGGGDGQDGYGESEGPPEPSAGVWVTAGIAALGLVSGTVFGFLALSEQSNFDATPTNETADRGELFALIADISFGVAGAAAITAIVLYIVEASMGSEEASASNFQLTPWGNAQGGGIAARLAF
jgi:tetratricopeptide (TPR) repeat protein